MAAYFLSDVHLRYDHPERADRLARFVATLDPASDDLTVVGDLCDFWFASRQVGEGDPLRRCAGLAGLADFRRRGGALTILAGNHDAWLGRFYEEQLGARFLPDAEDREVAGQRLRIAHGHRLKAATPWKTVLNSRAFLAGFRRLPGPVARACNAQLDLTNRRNQERFDRRGVAAYRAHVAALPPGPDLVILGHVHLPVDDRDASPRLVILGGWQTQTCFLRIDPDGSVRHHVA